MSIQSFLEDKKLMKVQLPTCINDDVSIWWLRARKDSAAQVKNIFKWVLDFEVH